jgi:hypothetical protein
VKKTTKAAEKFWPAKEVKELAEVLIEEHHQHLIGRTILYVFRSKASKKANRIRYAEAKRVSGLNAFLAYHRLQEEELEALRESGELPEKFLLVVVGHDMWSFLEPSQRVALIDHGLCHFGADGKPRGHDVEEFRQVIERHGLWMPVLKDFGETAAEALQQQTFDFEKFDKAKATPTPKSPQPRGKKKPAGRRRAEAHA